MSDAVCVCWRHPRTMAGLGNCFELLHNCEHIELEWPQQLKMCKDVTYAMEYLHSFDPQIIHRLQGGFWNVFEDYSVCEIDNKSIYNNSPNIGFQFLPTLGIFSVVIGAKK